MFEMSSKPSKTKNKPKAKPKPKPKPRSKPKSSPKPAKTKGPTQVGVVTKIGRALGLTPPPKTPVPGCGYRLKNMMKCHWKAIIGWGACAAVFGLFYDRYDHTKKLKVMWICMTILYLIRPVNISVIGLIPIFFLPLTGTINSRATCGSFMNAEILLFIASGMLILLINNCGNDRRIALAIMCFGDEDQFTNKKMLYKCSTAAYILGLISNRLVSCSMVTEYFTTAMMSVEKKYGNSDVEPELDEVRFVINNAIHTSSAVGAIAIIHSATATLCFRAIFMECVPDRLQEYPDLFNYLQYSVFAFPVSLVIFVLILFYNMVLIDKQAGGEMSKGCMAVLQAALLNRKAELPKDISLHEKLCITSLIALLLVHGLRWNNWFGGWSAFNMDEKSTSEAPIPAIKDTTVAAMFAILLHALPCGFKFVRYALVSKRKDLPPPKPESGILWWRYVDKNVNYGYFFLIGAGVAIMSACIATGLMDYIAENTGAIINNNSWNIGIFLVVFFAALSTNLLSPTAACSMLLPFVLCAATKGPVPWPQRSYLAALGVGIGTSFSFAFPFIYTPAYFCYYVGKVPKKKMLQYSVISVIIAFIVLWLALLYYAPLIWDPEDKGFTYTQPTTTEAPEAPAGDGKK